MQQRNFLCPKLGLGGGAGAVWEELDNERKRWQDPHSCNALEINALSIGPLCISNSIYSYCSKNKYENDTLFFFLLLTPYFWTKDKPKFSSRIKTYTLQNVVPTVFNILLHFCISFLFGATLLCKCIHGWRPSAILWANCIHLHSQMRRQVCLNFFTNWNELHHKQSKSLIRFLIIVSFCSNLW